MNDVHETNYDDHGPPPRVSEFKGIADYREERHKDARAKARNEVYRRIYGGHSADYTPEPTYPTWQDWLMRAIILGLAVVGLLMIGGTWL